MKGGVRSLKRKKQRRNIKKTRIRKIVQKAGDGS